MPRERSKRRIRTWVFALLTLLAIMGGGALPGAAQQRDEQREQRPALVVESPRQMSNASCLSTSCHGRQTALLGATETVQRSARAGRIWLQHDPHAHAAETVRGARYREILERWTTTLEATSPPLVRRAAVQCAACHDPLGESRHAQGVPVEHGIGCESCHGAASGWLTQHFERGITTWAMIELGLRDLKQPWERATLCASCHVGDATHDLNHDMLAAGHPPLRFEFSSELARLPAHWRAARISTQDGVTRDAELELWAAGQLASAASALHLLAARATRAQTDAAVAPRAPWPELAEYNCLSCHQQLRTASADNAAPKLVALADGPVAWSRWQRSLALPLAKQLGASQELVDEHQRVLKNHLEQPRPTAAAQAEVARHATRLAQTLAEVGGRLPRFADSRLADSRPTETPPESAPRTHIERLAARDVLQLARQGFANTTDWEAACQATLALEAVRRSQQTVGGRTSEAVTAAREAEQLLRSVRETLAYGERTERSELTPVDWPRLALPATSPDAKPARLRDWEAVRGTLLRVSELLRGIDALQ